MAGAHDMILALPRGYDTPIGTGGQGLSGGQRQRIALARALYGTPRLVVLDEPNASLDDAGEQALLDALGRLREAGATVVLVTHRPKVLAATTHLLLLRDGQAQRFGATHEVPRPPPGERVRDDGIALGVDLRGGQPPGGDGQHGGRGGFRRDSSTGAGTPWRGRGAGVPLAGGAFSGLIFGGKA